MSLEPIPDFFGRAIFCDDIRYEIEQKITYVGVYNGDMLVRGSFPITLPKFGIAATFAQKTELFRSDVGVRIFFPQDDEEKPSIESEAFAVPEKFLAKIKTAPGPMVLMGANIVFAPFTIQSPGFLRVRALRDGVLHRLGTLNIVAAPNQ